MDKKLQIRNSTTDFLVFTKQNGEDGIEVRVHDEDVWLTQKSMAQLFDCSTDNISLHLKNIFASGELSAEAVTEESSATASDGKKYRMKFYNLDAIISVGYRINSIRATQFRQWATKVLKTFTVLGYKSVCHHVSGLCGETGKAADSYDHGGLGEKTGCIS